MQKNTLEGKAKTKNGIKRLCFCAVCILLEVIFIVSMITRLNEYAEIVNLLTRLLGTILVLALYASDIPDHGCCVISADWFKWWHTEDAQTV